MSAENDKTSEETLDNQPNETNDAKCNSNCQCNCGCEEDDLENEAEETTELSEIDSLKEKNAELNDKFLRLYSEFDNYRKRTLKERAELIRTASEDIIKTLLPIVDDFDRAIISNENIEDISLVKEGYTLIYNKFKKTLEQQGLKEMEAMNLEFNPDLHEAITQIPAPSDDLKGKNVDVVEKGYTLNEKVIRYAKVVVGN